MSEEDRYRRLLLEAAQRFPPYPEGRHHGRGIVVCAGGLSHLANAFVCMKLLREHTDLPIELFYAGAAEMPAEVPRLLGDDLAPIAVRDITEPGLQTDPAVRMQPPLLDRYPYLTVRSFRGVWIKAFAILHSSFEEVFCLDADNMPIQPLEPLFESSEYRRAGAIFWPDLDRTRSTSEELFRVFGVTSVALKRDFEFESGQILLDKRRCWRALLTVCLANSDVEGFREYCYRHTLGDKDTFRLAFEAARQTYHLVPHPSRGVGNLLLFVQVPLTDLRLWIRHDLGSYFPTGMLQHDLGGRPMFIHKTVSEWELWRSYRNLGLVEEPDGATSALPLLSEWEERGYVHLEDFKRRYVRFFPREPFRELQGLAARGMTRVLDVVASVRRRLSRYRRSR